TSNNTVTATIPVGRNPSVVAISPDGTVAYVTNDAPGENSVSVIDVASNTVIDTIAVGQGPTGVAFSPDGTRAYVANHNSSTLSVIDTSTRTVIATINNLPSAYQVAEAPDGSRTYVTLAAPVPDFNGVAVIDNGSNTIVANIPIRAPGAIALTPDGSTAYV